jgi:hypothetical protein
VEAMTKQELLDKVSTTWSELEGTLAGIDLARLVSRRAEGDWTIKDALAHVTWYEQEMVGLLETRTFSGSPLWDLPLQPRNAAIYAQIKEGKLNDVLAQFHAVHARLVELLAGINEADLTDPAHFVGMPADWLPWQVISSNTYEHYPEHVQQIQAILGD